MANQLMHPRAATLIEALGLAPHPEGGYFRQIYCSTAQVDPRDGRSERAAITAIYFLLTADELSRWHRVSSDEVWHFLEGEPLELLQADPAFESVGTTILGPFGDGSEPVRVVPSSRWQAARTLGAYTLVSCTVGPGFDWADFQLLRDLEESPAVARESDQRITAFL